MALKPVWMEQVRRPERSQVSRQFRLNSLNFWPNEIEETSLGWAKAAWEQTSAVHGITPFIFFCLAVSFKSIFYIFLAKVAQYESSYRRTAHHAPVTEQREAVTVGQDSKATKVILISARET